MNITLADMRNMLRNIVATEGEDRRPVNPNSTVSGAQTCVYAVREGGTGPLVPVCFIGYLFHTWGLLGLLTYDPIAESQNNEVNQFDACMTTATMWQRLEDLGWEVSTEAREYARQAQRGQDSELTWGEAIKFADAYYLYEKRQEAKREAGIGGWENEPQPSEYRYHQGSAVEETEDVPF